MTKAIAFVIKHKIASLIVLIVIIAGGFGIHKLMNPSPESLLNKVEFEYKLSGYKDQPEVTGGVVDTKENENNYREFLKAVALKIADKAHFSDKTVKHIFDTTENPEEAIRLFRDTNSDVYAGQSDSNWKEIQAYAEHMDNLYIRYSDSKNLKKVTYSIEDTSKEPYIEKISKTFDVKQTKLKKRSTRYAKTSDIKITFEKTKYDKIINADYTKQYEQRPYAYETEEAKKELKQDVVLSYSSEYYLTIEYQGKKMPIEYGKRLIGGFEPYNPKKNKTVVMDTDDIIALKYPNADTSENAKYLYAVKNDNPNFKKVKGHAEYKVTLIVK